MGKNPLFLVFSSMELKLRAAGYGHTPFQMPPSYTSVGSGTTFFFYRVPGNTEEIDMLLTALRPFERIIGGVFIDDKVDKKKSKTIILTMTEKLGLGEPEIIESFL